MEFSVATDVGRVRAENEDGYCLLPVQPRGYLMAVADGVGGLMAGGQASLLALHTLEEKVRQGPVTHPAGFLREAFLAAHRRILQVAPAGQMGTTLTAAVQLGEELYVAHVGDSRLYLLRDGELVQLTHDHSVVGELLRRGSLTREQARLHPQRHVLTNAVGGVETLMVEEGQLSLRRGDVLLLCTDGLTSLADEEEIAALLREDPLGEAARRLVSLANLRGGHDNVTVLVARYTGEEAAPRDAARG